jgi:hypothetical protein
VCNFVQRTGIKAMRKDDAMMRMNLIGRQIDRLIVTRYQFSIVAEKKKAVEQPNQRLVIRFSH